MTFQLKMSGAIEFYDQYCTFKTKSVQFLLIGCIILSLNVILLIGEWQLYEEYHTEGGEIAIANAGF